MSTVTVDPRAGEPAGPASPESPPAPRRWLWWYVPAALVAAWLLPAATHAVRADWLLPLVIWALTASLLRNGRTALDRLMLAAVLLAGATCLAGLVISVWPWGMAPVPVAGAALSGLVLIGAATGRRPSVPAPRRSDLVPLLSGALAAVVLLLPYAGRSLAERIGLVMLGEDIARHFSVYDGIGAVQGYAFIDRHATDAYLLAGLQTYPQGSHFLAALLDSFMRSGARATDPVDAFNHYLGYHVAGYVFLAVALVWAMRWVAGPALAGWPKVALYGFVIAAASFSELVTMFVRGYPSEILGLALFAVLLALLARPPRHTRETLVAVAALIVGISWAYFFLLPFVGLAAAASLVAYRHRVTAHWITALLAALVTVPLALTPYLIMYSDRVSPLADLLPGGPVEGVNRGTTVAIAALILAGIAATLRSPVRRMIGIQLIAVGALSVALGLYQIATVGHLSYYFDKAVHALYVTCLVGLAGLSPLLARFRGGNRLQHTALAALVVFGIFASFGAVPLQRPSAQPDRYGVEPIRNVSWGVAHAVGNLQSPRLGRVVGAVLERYPEPDGRLTQVVFNNKSGTYLSTLFVSVLHRNYGTLTRVPKSATPLYEDPERNITVLDFAAPRRIIVVNNPELAEQLQAVLDTRPDLDVELVSMEVDTTVGSGR